MVHSLLRVVSSAGAVVSGGLLLTLGEAGLCGASGSVLPRKKRGRGRLDYLPEAAWNFGLMAAVRWSLRSPGSAPHLLCQGSSRVQDGWWETRLTLCLSSWPSCNLSGMFCHWKPESHKKQQGVHSLFLAGLCLAVNSPGGPFLSPQLLQLSSVTLYTASSSAGHKPHLTWQGAHVDLRRHCPGPWGGGFRGQHLSGSSEETHGEVWATLSNT
jgi:hypothetical protein